MLKIICDEPREDTARDLELDLVWCLAYAVLTLGALAAMFWAVWNVAP